MLTYLSVTSLSPVLFRYFLATFSLLLPLFDAVPVPVTNF